jgi:tetratricopeptide (TPR) repeat protein
MRTTRAAILLALLASAPWPQAAQGAEPGDALNDARARYESAHYEEALALLDSLDTTNKSEDENQAIRQYRALCLIALGRLPDAAKPVEAMIRANPLAPIDGDLPPRLRDLLTQLRPRVARELAKECYENGRDLYQRRDFPAASRELTRALNIIDDPGLGIARDPAFTDIRLVVDGFLKLATEAATSAPPATLASSAAKGPQRGATSESQTPAAAPAPDRGSASQSRPAEFIPPKAMLHALPPLPRLIEHGPAREGELELEIGPDGSVSDAKITVSIHPAYDPILLEAVRTTWQYAPALRNGVAVASAVKVRVVLPPR